MGVRWFQRKQKISNVELLESLRILGRNLHMEHTMTVKYAPRPRPSYLYVVIENHEGQRWQLPGMQVTGQYAIPINLPIEWLTGRSEDASRLPPATLRIEYQEG